MPRSWPIRWWLVTLSLAVGLPLLVLLGWMFATEVRRERNDARETALRIAQGTEVRLRTLHAESAALLARMAAREALRGPQSGCDELFAVVEFFPQYVNLFLVSADGTMVCSAEVAPQQTALSSAAEAWVRDEIRSGRFRVGQPIIRFVDGQWISVLSARTPAGILALVQLPDLLGSAPLPAHTTVTIIDRDGVVLARSAEAERWTGRSVRGAEVTEMVLRLKRGRAEARGIDGVPRQYGFTEIANMGWYVYAGVPTATVMAPVKAMALRSLTGGALVVLLVFLFAIRLARTIQKPIDRLSRAAHVVAKEGFSATVPVGGPREVAMLGEAMNEMIRARAEAESRLIESQRNLKNLSDRLLTVQEEERGRIARELHDDLGQSLTALKMDVQGLLDSTRSGSRSVRQRIVQTLDATTQAVQRISAELRPSILDDLGLTAALEAEARLFEERSAIEVDLSIANDDLSLGDDASTAIYRIVQEALTNVARHSDATRLEIRLRRRGNEVVLEIRDDGRGITPEEIVHSSSLGLMGIRERAAMLGGTAVFEGVPEHGTIVSVRFPVRSER